MTARNLDPIAGLTLEMRPSADGESYIFGTVVKGAFIPLTDVKAGRVDFALDEELQRQHEEAAAKQTEIAPEPGTLASTDPGSAPPGTPGDEPEQAPPAATTTPAEQTTPTAQTAPPETPPAQQ